MAIDAVLFTDLFNVVDLPVMVGIATTSFAIYRSKAIPNVWGDLLPWVLGAVYGSIDGSYAQHHLPIFIFKGIVVNGGAAWMLAIAARRVLPPVLDGPQTPQPPCASGNGVSTES